MNSPAVWRWTLRRGRRTKRSANVDLSRTSKICWKSWPFLYVVKPNINPEKVEAILIGMIHDQVSDYVGADYKFTSETRLVRDLQFDSLDVVELVMDIESNLLDNKSLSDKANDTINSASDFTIGELATLIRGELPAP